MKRAVILAIVAVLVLTVAAFGFENRWGNADTKWSDLYLADGGVVYFGADQDVSLTHVADTGLTLLGRLTLTDGTDPAIIGQISEPGTTGAFLRIGLDESTRTMVICDYGDIANDFNMTAKINPLVSVYNAAGTEAALLQYNMLALAGASGSYDPTVIGNGLFFHHILDHSRPEVFKFAPSPSTSATIEATASSGTQDFLVLKPEWRQTGTAGSNVLALRSSETTLGSGTHNLIYASTYAANDTDPFAGAQTARFLVSNTGKVTHSLLVNTPQTYTVADSGADADHATQTVLPTSSVVEITCNDDDGCTIPLDETGAVPGQVVTLLCLGPYHCDFTDTPGLTEIAGAFEANAFDNIVLRYTASTFYEVSRSNN